MKRVFAGFGAPPTEKATSEAIVNYVKTTSGAIDFVKKSVAKSSGLCRR